MDEISGLPDDLLVKILSFLPTKVAVSTSILSKQWEFLWMLLPKLEYNCSDYSKSEYESLRCFLHKNLPLHRASVLESFCLKLPLHIKHEDIKLWVLAVVSRCVRELKISSISFISKTDILPSSLYTCKSLVTLTLKGSILVDVPRMVCLPCLKNLQLRNVTYLKKDSFQRLLSICPVLEDLLVYGYEGDNLGKLTVIVSSLLRLVLCIYDEIDVFVINTPSLEYLKLAYYNSPSHPCLIEYMPMLKEAYLDIDFDFPDMERLIGSFTSVKHLTLCLEDYNTLVYGDDILFNKLEHLKLCLRHKYSPRVLVQFLKDSPNLRVLDLIGMEDKSIGVYLWDQPSTVPECLLSSLQTFKWSGYQGSPEERDVATYILRNARRLKTATIMLQPRLFETLDMVKELTLSPRASTTCQLVFV